ncbi:MAG: NADH-quinone oxidoreductase subunit L, partial [candidate division Zixibacteria bacterium]|nr:NADH-quinone oxidoreductase subunit L [candidate division Zixibacteria bacterium]
MSGYLFLIPVLPLIGFLINGLFIGRIPKTLISIVGCLSVGLSFVLSLVLFFELKCMPVSSRVIQQVLFTRIPSGNLKFDIA